MTHENFGRIKPAHRRDLEKTLRAWKDTGIFGMRILEFRRKEKGDNIGKDVKRFLVLCKLSYPIVLHDFIS